MGGFPGKAAWYAGGIMRNPMYERPTQLDPVCTATLVCPNMIVFAAHCKVAGDHSFTLAADPSEVVRDVNWWAIDGTSVKSAPPQLALASYTDAVAVAKLKGGWVEDFDVPIAAYDPYLKADWVNYIGTGPKIGSVTGYAPTSPPAEYQEPFQAHMGNMVYLRSHAGYYEFAGNAGGPAASTTDTKTVTICGGDSGGGVNHPRDGFSGVAFGRKSVGCNYRLDDIQETAYYLRLCRAKKFIDYYKNKWCKGLAVPATVPGLDRCEGDPAYLYASPSPSPKP